jgi:hypothetical protein
MLPNNDNINKEYKNRSCYPDTLIFLQGRKKTTFKIKLSIEQSQVMSEHEAIAKPRSNTKYF